MAPRQRPDDGPARGRPPAARIGWRGRAARREVLPFARNPGRGPDLEQQAHPEAGVHDQGVGGRLPGPRLLQHPPIMGRGARLRGLGADQPAQQSQPLAAGRADAPDHAERNRGQGLASLRAIVRRRTVLQARAPEARDVGRQRLIACMATRLPCALRKDLLLPGREQLGAGPRPVGQTTPGATHRRGRQPAGTQRGHHGAAGSEQAARQQHPEHHHQTQISPDRDPLYQRAQQAHHAVHYVWHRVVRPRRGWCESLTLLGWPTRWHLSSRPGI